MVYFVSALLLGLAYLGYSFAFARSHSVKDARRLMLASVLYLPVLLVTMVVDRLILV
jgi:protoheme IX farnesyltransferase